MATVYYVDFGTRRTYEGDSIHGPMQVFDTFARLILIDGEGDRDRWLKDPRGDHSNNWPDDGIWTVTTSSRQMTFTHAYDGKLLGKLTFPQWPFRRGDEGKVVLSTPYNGKSEYLFYVSRIE